MILKTEYKNIHFQIVIEKEVDLDLSQMMGDKFNRLPPQTMLEIKKGKLFSYNLIITSIDNEEEFTHYLSSILLTSDENEFLSELSDYLDQEGILENITLLRNQYKITPGPHWKI